MARFDWSIDIGGTPELLACVPGLSVGTLRAWMQRGQLAIYGRGTGNRMTWTALDVLQVAARVELSRLGVAPDQARRFWQLLEEGAVHHLTLPEGAEMPDVVAVLCHDPITRCPVVHVLDPEAEPPVACVVFQLGRFIQQVAAQIEQVVL